MARSGRVNRAAAAQGLFVELSAGLHVFTDVGDGDPGAEAVGLLFDPHRVVVVARVFRIDRRQRHGTKVHAPVQVERQEPHGHGFGFANGTLRVLFGDLLADQDLGDLDVRIARRAEHRDQLALRIFVAKLGEFGDLGHRGVAVLAELHGVREHDRTA